MIEVPDMTEVAGSMLRQSCPPKGQHVLDRCGGVGSQESHFDIDAAIELEAALAGVEDDDNQMALAHAAEFAGEPHGTQQESVAPEQPSQAVIDGDGSEGENAVAVAGGGFTPAVREARLRIPGALSSTDTYAQKWKDVFEACQELERDGILVPPAASLSIVGSTAELFQAVQDAFPAEGDMMKRIVVGALVLYRMRLSDISIREHVHLLWIICGDTQLRCHDGVVFYYEAALGCWETFGGLLPQDTRS